MKQMNGFALAVALAMSVSISADAANPSMLESFSFDKVELFHPLSAAARKVVVQVSVDYPERWNLALNNVGALQRFFGNDKVQIVLVAFGPGLRMLFKDSPAAARIAELDAAGVEFDACNNTLQGMAKAMGHVPELLPAAVIVPAGVVRIMQLEGAGFAYIRP